MGAVIGILALVGIGVASYFAIKSLNDKSVDSKSNDGNDESIVGVDKQPVIANEEILYTDSLYYPYAYNPYYYYSSYPYIRRLRGRRGYRYHRRGGGHRGGGRGGRGGGGGGRR